VRWLAALSAIALAVSLLLDGPAPVGRILLAAGLPGLAVPFLGDDGWRGAALYRAGRMEEAAAAFGRAGEVYNLGTAEARRGNYAAALEAYDRVIPLGDAEARVNFDLIAAFYAGLGIDPASLGVFPAREEGPTAEGFVAEGDGRAAGTGDTATNANALLGLAELESLGKLGVRRVFDERFMAADDRWLAQLEDVPGAYLAARIAAERKRRAALGLAPPEPEDPR